MKIAYVTPRFHPHIGGVETHVYEIAKRIAKEFEVEVLTTDPTGKLPKIDEIEGFRVRRFRSYAPSEAYYFSPELYNYLKRNSEEYDLIHGHNYHALTSVISFMALKNKDVKYVITPHTFGLPQKFVRRLAHYFYKPAAQKMLQKANKVITVSRSEKKTIEDLISIRLNNIEHIPLFISIPEEYNFEVMKKDEIKLLFVGRLSYEKNVDILISAFRFVEKELAEFKKIKLIIVGDGPLRSNLEKMAKFSPNINFAGSKSREELKKIYMSSDLLILPSKFEVLGMCVLEAMSYGIPVITTPVGDLRYLENWRHCVFTEVGNAKDLAEKIKYLSNNPTEARKIGLRGRRYAEKYHDADNVIKRYEMLYREVMS